MSRTATFAAIGIALSVFVCHKQVLAAPIAAVDPDAHALTITLPTGEPHTFAPAEGFFARTIPAVGDYFVVYEDGYQSHSPKAVFEAGYRLVESGTDGDMVSSAIGERPSGPDAVEAKAAALIEMLGGKSAGLLSDEGLARAIAATPAERVTEEYIRSRIVGTDYMAVPGTTVTICHITLDNGYSVRGESACVNPANFRQDIGERIAHDDAFRKLWPLFGFLLAEANHRRGHGVPAVPVDLIARTAFEAEHASDGDGDAWGDLTATDRAIMMERVSKLLADPTGEGEDVTFRAVVRGLTA